jgi:hypothetical protein
VARFRAPTAHHRPWTPKKPSLHLIPEYDLEAARLEPLDLWHHSKDIVRRAVKVAEVPDEQDEQQKQSAMLRIEVRKIASFWAMTMMPSNGQYDSATTTANAGPIVWSRMCAETQEH